MLFAYNNYKKYLSDTLAKNRGERAKLARSLKCDPAFITRVLNGDPHLSLEQGEKVSRFLGHNSVETRYFLALINLSRSGTASLQDFFHAELVRIRQENDDLRNRFEQNQNEMSEEAQSKYYSSWAYAAIDSLVSSQICTSANDLAKSLNLSQDRCARILEELVRWGIIISFEDGSFAGAEHIHLHQGSANITKHHVNWRLKAMQSLDGAAQNDFHYSGLYTLSKDDAYKLRKELLTHVEAAVNIAKASHPETLFTLGIDFFQV